MMIITITKWRRKLWLLLVVAIFFIGLSISINSEMNPQNSSTTLPSDNLQQDIMTQPLKVQGLPTDGQQPDKPQDKVQEQKGQ